MRRLVVARHDGANLRSQAIKGVHRFAPLAVENQRVNRTCFVIVDDGPKTDAADALANAAANAQERLFTFRLKERETMLGCDADVCFEHNLF